MPSNIEISIDGFTGPLDLLCHLVENRQMQASKIKVAQLVRIYGAYLSKTRNASADVISEFFFMAANLLLHKVLSLLPSNTDNSSSGLEEDELYEDVISEEELLARMSRFSPYRTATNLLLERKNKQDRKFNRIALQADVPDGKLVLVYDLGDLYYLSKLWWDLLEAKTKKNNLVNEFDEEDECWDGVPGSLPDEARIQTRIEEISAKLRKSPMLYLSALIEEQKALSVRSVSTIVVTLLALLEMCRMKRISIFQEELFGEIRINAAFSDGVAY